MTYALVTTQHFERRARKFLRKHPDLRSVFADTLEKLRQDPFQTSLRLHALSGALTGIQATSLTHSYRLTLTLKLVEGEIGLLDVGSHDAVYR